MFSSGGDISKTLNGQSGICLNHFNLTTMRNILTSLLLFFSIIAFGQKKDKFSLLLQIQPELTFHKNDYAFRWSEKKNVSTFNIGLNASLEYKLTERFFVDFGLGYISRKLNTMVFLDQSHLPSPYADSTTILYTTKSVSFQTLQIPLGIGYNFIKTEKAKMFIKGTYIPNFILTTQYEVNSYPAFKKNMWQGYSMNLGVGFDYLLSKKIQLTNSLMYSILNTVAKDFYTFSQDENEIALTHNYLQLSIGVKIKL